MRGDRLYCRERARRRCRRKARIPRLLRAGNERIDAECNERIADHALEHGTANGSVMAFIQAAERSRVVWLDGKDADCWAINKYQISPEPPRYEKCVIDSVKRVLGK